MYTHEFANSQYVMAPDWYTEWVAENDIWGIYEVKE